jgi:hypothetical protein
VALLLGAVGMYAYFSLIGIVKFISMKQGLDKWIFHLPKSLQETVFLAHCSVEGLLVSLAVFGSLGIFLGRIVENKPLLFGFIEFLGAAIFYFAYHYLVLHGDFLWMEDVPAWSQILPFFLWLFICLTGSLVGNSRFKRNLTT